jgi:hypothetical protein
MCSVAVLGSVAVLLASAVFATPAAAAGTKVEVCHLGDDGGFHLISISQHALDAHIRHGDGMVGDDVPGMDGFVFGEDCAPVEVPPSGETIEPGCYGSSIYTDLYYLGPIDTPGNVVGYGSFEGVCTPGTQYGGGEAIILAADLDAALLKCESLGLYLDVEYQATLNALGYAGFPTDAWICSVP